MNLWLKRSEPKLNRKNKPKKPSVFISRTEVKVNDHKQGHRFGFNFQVKRLPFVTFAQCVKKNMVVLVLQVVSRHLYTSGFLGKWLCSKGWSKAWNKHYITGGTAEPLPTPKIVFSLGLGGAAGYRSTHAGSRTVLGKRHRKSCRMVLVSRWHERISDTHVQLSSFSCNVLPASNT